MRILGRNWSKLSKRTSLLYMKILFKKKIRKIVTEMLNILNRSIKIMLKIYKN